MSIISIHGMVISTIKRKQVNLRTRGSISLFSFQISINYISNEDLKNLKTLTCNVWGEQNFMNLNLSNYIIGEHVLIEGTLPKKIYNNQIQINIKQIKPNYNKNNADVLSDDIKYYYNLINREEQSLLNSLIINKNNASLLALYFKENLPINNDLEPFIISLILNNNLALDLLKFPRQLTTNNNNHLYEFLIKLHKYKLFKKYYDKHKFPIYCWNIKENRRFQKINNNLLTFLYNENLIFPGNKSTIELMNTDLKNISTYKELILYYIPNAKRENIKYIIQSLKNNLFLNITYLKFINNISLIVKNENYLTTIIKELDISNFSQTKGVDILYITDFLFKQNVKIKKIVKLIVKLINEPSTILISDIAKQIFLLNEQKFFDFIHLNKNRLNKNVATLHNYISNLYRNFKLNYKNIYFDQIANFKILSGVEQDKPLIINNTEYYPVIPKDSYTLIQWGSEMNNCIASYSNKICKGKCIIIGLIKDDELVFNIEIDNKMNLIQIFRQHNQKLNSTEFQVITDWLFSLGLIRKKQPQIEDSVDIIAMY